MIDHTKVKPGDRFRVTRAVVDSDEVGKEVTFESLVGAAGFRATDGRGYTWDQVEPITEPALTTRPIEGMPDWLASTPKGVSVKCRVKYINTAAWNTTPSWICGYRKALFIDENGKCWACAEPWTEPEPKPSLFTPEQLAELDARYARKEAPNA